MSDEEMELIERLITTQQDSSGQLKRIAAALERLVELIDGGDGEARVRTKS
jgi:hypothetical protein